MPSGRLVGIISKQLLKVQNFRGTAASKTSGQRRWGGHGSATFSSGGTEEADCVVVGAGVVGLAIARQMALRGRDVLVLEATATIGTGTSARSSEVIHAGIYYPRGSLKAELCVQGRNAMYAYCQDHGLPHKRIGKLIVATSPDQVHVLERLQRAGNQNGVLELEMLAAGAARDMEPELRCIQALWSPNTGIVDSHALMLAFQGDAERLGAAFSFNSSVTGGRAGAAGIELQVTDTLALKGSSGSCEHVTISAKTVINAAGLNAQSLARALKGVPPPSIPPRYYARGCYFSLSGAGRAPFSRLIYPVPEEGGIGVHVTMDMAGQTKFGPDVEWLPDLPDEVSSMEHFDYTVDPLRAVKFYGEIRKYFPALPDNCLVPDYAGIRPKLYGPGQVAADFVVQGPDAHGIPGLIQLFGIESPGLTSSMAIARLTADILSRQPT